MVWWQAAAGCTCGEAGSPFRVGHLGGAPLGKPVAGAPVWHAATFLHPTAHTCVSYTYKFLGTDCWQSAVGARAAGPGVQPSQLPRWAPGGLPWATHRGRILSTCRPLLRRRRPRHDNTHGHMTGAVQRQSVTYLMLFTMSSTLAYGRPAPRWHPPWTALPRCHACTLLRKAAYPRPGSDVHETRMCGPLMMRERPACQPKVPATLLHRGTLP